MLDPLMSEKDTLKATTLGRTKFRELVRAGEFPPPMQVTTCRVAWRSSDVQSWIDQRPIADAYQENGSGRGMAA
jgi:predicted DNA-binding transcriptional regulator AlpA